MTFERSSCYSTDLYNELVSFKMWLKLANILEKILGVVDLNNGQGEGGENYVIDNGKESEKLWKVSSLFVVYNEDY